MTKSIPDNTFSLKLFTFIWSNIAILQGFRSFYSTAISTHFATLFNHNFTINDNILDKLTTYPLSYNDILFIFLLISIISAIFLPNRSIVLLSLSLSHLLSLLIQGSYSNHVIVASIICTSILLTYDTNRHKWLSQLSSNIYFLLIILYVIPGIDKLNTDWFSPQYSCSTLFTSGFLSMLLPIPTTTNSYNYLFIRFMLDYAPYFAIVLEFGLPLLLILWRYTSCTTYTTVNTILYKILIIIAALFHLMICLPLPPLSAYPFRLVIGHI